MRSRMPLSLAHTNGVSIMMYPDDWTVSSWAACCDGLGLCTSTMDMVGGSVVSIVVRLAMLF